MTCIVALKDNGRIYMGADSAITFGNVILDLNIPKIHKVGKFILGYAGHVKVGQIIKSNFIETEEQGKESDLEYIIKKVGEIKTILNDNGIGHIENNQEWQSNDILIAYKKEMYRVGSWYSVSTFRHDYISIGSGEEYALGALYAGASLSPRTRITQALEAAAKFSKGVCGPFMYLESDD